MDKKIGVIGHVGVGKSEAVLSLKDKSIGLIGIHKHGIEMEEVLDEIFILNGIRYAPIKKEKAKHNPTKPDISIILSAASLMYTPYMNDISGYGENGYTRKLPHGIDIIKEYGLIQSKKSNLSKWERDMVIRVFEKSYYRVP